APPQRRHRGELRRPRLPARAPRRARRAGRGALVPPRARGALAPGRRRRVRARRAHADGLRPRRDRPGHARRAPARRGARRGGRARGGAAMTRAELAAVARLDGGEVLRSRWLGLCVALYGLLAAAFVLVGLRESTVLGFTGLGRVLFSLCHALVLVLPLLALLATVQAVNRARDDGSLELFLSQPIGRG